MLVAIYARVSTADQNAQMQVTELTAYVQARGWSIFQVYTDQASGTNEQRAAFRRLMNDAGARRFDAVLVWKLDRFGRSLRNLVVSLQTLTDLGVGFLSLRDSIDLTTAAGRLMVHMIGAFAEFEAAIIRERVVAGLAHSRLKGTVLGRPRLPVSEDVFRLRERGKSHRQIARLVGMSRSSVARALAQKPSSAGTSR